MFAKTYGATTLGIDGRIIDVEVDVSPGLPGFELVGLPDTSVKESKERVRTAIRNSGIQLRQERVTVNLAPADVRKDSSGLDLPIAVGLLASYGMVPEAALQNALFSAELSLDGNCRPISGILPMAITARENGLTEFYVAPSNADEALLIDGLKVFEQEAAELFGELANRAVGDIAERMHWKEGDPRKIFLKSLTAGIMNRIAGGSFGKGMTAGAVNELLIARLLSWQDAYGHPIIPTELLQGISYGAGMAIDGTEGAVIAQSGTKHNIFEHLEDFLDEQEREAFLKAVEVCGGDEYEVAQVFEQGGYLQRALSRIGKTPTPGYEYKPIIYTKADGTKFVRIVEVEKNASTKTPDEDGFTKTNIIDDKNSSHTEERIYWGPWRRTTQIAENPKEDTEQERSDEDNTATTIQKNDVNNKDSKGNRSNDKQGEKTRGNSTETTGNPKDNSKKENTDPNRERRVELGKTIGIETFKFGGDLPVTLLNKQADSLAKEYRSLQKEIPAYVVKQGRLTKVGVLSPLGLIYDTYQDAQKYNGGKFVGAVAINTGAFVGTILLDSALTSTGVGAIGVIATNVFVAEGTTWLKEKVLDEPKVEEKH